MTRQAPTYRSLWLRLTSLYEEREAQAVVRMVLEEAFSLSFSDIVAGGTERLGRDALQRLDSIMERLVQAEPVQYVLGRATFCGHTYRVAPGVLIPRPETAGLLALLPPLAGEGDTLLDVGTGSGCIAIEAALAHPALHVEAWDISARALAIARDNAQRLAARVAFCQRDALHTPADRDRWTCVVSNPPYIPERERAAMDRNVTQYEPPAALFVPDRDPLLFYRAIARYAADALRCGGSLLFECHTDYTDSTARMLREMGFTRVDTHRDIYDRPRFVTAHRP